MIQFIESSRISKLFYSYRSMIVLPEGGREGRENGIVKGYKDVSEVDEYAHYLDCGDGFTGIHIQIYVCIT